MHLSCLQNVKGKDGDSEPHTAPCTLGVLSMFSDKNDNRPKGREERSINLAVADVNQVSRADPGAATS